MIWLYFLIPIIIVGAIAVYFEKKSGMNLPEEGKQLEQLGETLNQNRINSGGIEIL